MMLISGKPKTEWDLTYSRPIDLISMEMRNGGVKYEKLSSCRVFNDVLPNGFHQERKKLLLSKRFTKMSEILPSLFDTI